MVPYPKLDKEQGDGIANEAQFLVKAERKKASQGEKVDVKNKLNRGRTRTARALGFELPRSTSFGITSFKEMTGFDMIRE